MSRNHEFEVEALLETEFGADFESEYEVPSDDTAAASAAAGQRASRDLYGKYKAACRGRRRLKTLSRKPPNLFDETLMLNRRIQNLPHLFADLAALKARSSKMTDQQYTSEYAKLVTALGYPPDIYLGTLQDALADAKCELAWNSWMWAATCNGMEVEDPGLLSAQAADHYLDKELHLNLQRQQVSCDPNSQWCDVTYPGGIVIHVALDNVPDSLHVSQVAPSRLVPREFRYTCFERTASFF